VFLRSFVAIAAIVAVGAVGCAYDWTQATTGTGGQGGGATGASASGVTSTQTGATTTNATSTGAAGSSCIVTDFKNLAERPCPTGFLCVQPGGCDSSGTCETPEPAPAPAASCTCADTLYPSAAAAADDGLPVIAATDCLPTDGSADMRCGSATCTPTATEAAVCHHVVEAEALDDFSCASITDCGADPVADPCGCFVAPTGQTCTKIVLAPFFCLASCTVD
jgi:hypothetical protein